VYDHFDPAVQAGGPITSLRNLVNLFQGDCKISVFTSNRELDGRRLDVRGDEWLAYSNAKVMYADRFWSWKGAQAVLDETKPKSVYLNGVYSLVGVVWMLLALRRARFSGRVVLCPRGMLLPGAMAQKKLKKSLYLPILRWLVSMDNLHWHVTSEVEKAALAGLFPGLSETHIHLVGNVPRMDLSPRKSVSPNDPKRFTTIALISPMKNIHLNIEALAGLENSVEYHIHGPIKDDNYWHQCKKSIARLPEHIKVSYHGEVAPGLVQSVLERTDFYVQASTSENFGHSIFEAMLVGVPVITSSTTPWDELEQRRAGFIVPPGDLDALRTTLRKAFQMSGPEYEEFANNARQYAMDYLASADLKPRYSEMFQLAPAEAGVGKEARGA
jgi:glycosyltransferase involved in cell wall biosynthesis